MSRQQADQVALARDGLDKPDRFPQRNIKPGTKLSDMARRLLSAHVTIASSWKVLWWLPSFNSLTLSARPAAPSAKETKP